MKFRNPFFIENMMRDQPYCSLLLVAPFCDGACPGCQNQDLSAENIIDIPVEQLVKEYKNNPFVDGITVAGLEICLSGDQFINDLFAFIDQTKVQKITIYSRYSQDFPKLNSILKTLAEFPHVQELYCKTGSYSNNDTAKVISLKSTDEHSRIWQISLASANQDFHVIKGSHWEKCVA